ncbi:MAG: hypothetical protein D6798_11045 [Deltaproteobacteria bacterium]|nr:MAG: hypothetical protein D6798_11045 [Deltaproteobacteria bacterium]
MTAGSDGSPPSQDPVPPRPRRGAAPRVVDPGSFDDVAHFYPKALNAALHPQLRFFASLGNERIATRYCHLHPKARRSTVIDVLTRCPEHFRWGGADLFPVTTESGERRIVVIETNSCPSGQKSYPRTDEVSEQGGYRILVERSFAPTLAKRRALPRGGLAVLFDKNEMEASGYAAAMADVFDEPVHLVPCMDGDPDPGWRFNADRVLEVRSATSGEWQPIRGALRYVTQRPWNRIPATTRTCIYNPVLTCLSGGRNKLMAAKAYDLLNAELSGEGLAIRVPETIWDVSKDEVSLWVERMGGVAVVKDPYSNAGQGVFTITRPAELDAFMRRPARYDRFIVQALIGNVGWSSRSRGARLYHIGTVPDRRGRIHVADLRMMVAAGPEGFFPVAVYARRARAPLPTVLDAETPSWDVLGTNLSVRDAHGDWATQTERLVLMDQRDFSRLGLGLDDLIEAYIETVLAMTAIDRMAGRLMNTRRRLNRRLFRSLDPDPSLLAEIRA